MYNVVRFFKDHEPSRKVIKKTGLTLAEAQKHCRDKETSSSTCKGSAAKARTKRLGEWFDGYEEAK